MRHSLIVEVLIVVCGGISHIACNRLQAKLQDRVFFVHRHDQNNILLLPNLDLVNTFKELLRNKQALFCYLGFHHVLQTLLCRRFGPTVYFCARRALTVVRRALRRSSCRQVRPASSMRSHTSSCLTWPTILRQPLGCSPL